MVQFKSEPPFESPWEAFVKTTVMMTNEFEYSTLFKENENLALPVFGRILFLCFLLMVGIVLMNLLVGMAVSDINYLETQGKMNRLRKQADFLRIIQPPDFNLWLMPKWLKRRVPGIKVQPPIKLCPGNPQSNEHLALPKSIVDAIIARAEQQRKTEDIYTIQDLIKNLNELVTSLNKHSTVTNNFNSESRGRYLQKIKDMYKEVHETSRCECENFTARKLENIELELSAIKASIKELTELLPQQFSVQVQ